MPKRARTGKMIEALIFDFDGLIVDTEEPSVRAWTEIYQEYGCELPIDLLISHIGKATDDISFDPYEYLESELGRPIDRDSIRARRCRRNNELILAQPIRPGVEAYIADAQHLGLKLAVASSSPRDWVEGHLTRLGLRTCFACIMCVDDVGKGKPDPAVYLATLKRLELTADRAIALEDSPNGAWAAERAGIYCVVVPNSVTSQLLFDHGDRRLESLADLSLAELIREVDETAGAQTDG